MAKEISWIRELCEAAAAPGVGSALCGVKDGVQQALVENNLGELTVVNDTVAVHICFSDHFVNFLVLHDVHASERAQANGSSSGSTGAQRTVSFSPKLVIT